MQHIELENSLKHFQQALLRNPKDLDAQLNCGNLCLELLRFEEAAGYFRRLVRVLKTNQYVHKALCFSLVSLGNQAQLAGQFVLAAGCFEEALAHQPRSAAYWYNLGNAQRELGLPTAALESFTKSIKLNPDDADAHNNLGNILRELGQLDKAILSYETALKINPNLHHALAHLVHQRQHICDWAGKKNDSLNKQINMLRKIVTTQPSAQISPFAFLAMPTTTPQEQKKCASNYANNMFAHLSDLRKTHAVQPNKSIKPKLKIGYLSADFRLHPLAFLITELIENHDKTQFETFAYSYGLDDKTLARKRLEKAFDYFNDIRLLTDIEAATKINADQIDILVDLTGYTQSSRSALIALKPAPIAINWLGYPGTMGELAGEPLFDYMIADHIVAPNQADFSEQLLYLPFYQPNNATRPVGKANTKLEHNLPESAFVFCCFNQSFKITAEIFSAWMQILKAVPNSVLWLLDCNKWAKANLQAAAELAGVANERLIFAPRVPIETHLARHVHADLFLDTLPYNAHTTASDAVYMGLPLLTCTGNTFASRVAASLLTCIRANELVTNQLTDYTNKAIELANNPTQLRHLKQHIKQYAHEYKLFNPAYFMQQLAFEYQKIWKNYHNSV